MSKAEVNYSSLANESNPFIQHVSASGDEELATDTDNDDTPQHSGLMIHVVPDTSKARWNHIEDLDSFFTRMYNYHQKHGFAVMMLQEVFELGQFIFVVLFVTFLVHCVNYPVLFGDVKLNSTKVKLHDAVYPMSQSVLSISGWSWFVISLAILFWFFRLAKVITHAVQYWDIKKFYNSALKIMDSELDNLTWHEVQRKIREVQAEQQMCIHKEQLTELDIYHRILRFENYMVAMMNKNLIPSKLCLPILGESVCFSSGLRYHIELILFRCPWSPFENNWHLKDEFKRSNKRIELAQKLSRQITWFALAYLILSPLIFLWALMVFFFSYADLIKREPGTLGTRCWSQYGQLYMRHFNELDHELTSRLNRAYRPAVKYMSSFSSALMAVYAQNMVFICGGMLSVFILLTLYDEDVVQVEHVLTIMSILTGIVVISRVFIPDENQIWCPEQLMTAVLAHTHYLPVTWRGLAHTNQVRTQFGEFFQFRFIYMLNELISPITTPYILMFHVRSRTLEIVDFFRNFTVSVVGVGDVCSFAQMDVRKHGNPDWQTTHPSTDPVPTTENAPCETNQYTQGENGKTELSLVHFTLTNPGWKMPVESKQFVHGIRRHALLDIDAARMCGNQTAMEQSLFSVGSMGGEYSSIIQSVLQNQRMLGGGHSQMGLSAIFPNQTPFNARNYGASTATATNPLNSQKDTNINSPGSDGYDFQHMLHQHLSSEGAAASTGGQQHSFLQSIQEDDNSSRQEQSGRPNDGFFGRNSQSVLGASMGASMTGGLSRREGAPEGSHDGLLQSICTGSQGAAFDFHPTDVTSADMCLSTLYLHELHHRQLRRRGLSTDNRYRSQWQRSHHQQQPQQQHQVLTQPQSTSNTSISYNPSSSLPTSAVERTPLLYVKKS